MSIIQCVNCEPDCHAEMNNAGYHSYPLGGDGAESVVCYFCGCRKPKYHEKDRLFFRKQNLESRLVQLKFNFKTADIEIKKCESVITRSKEENIEVSKELKKVNKQLSLIKQTDKKGEKRV